mmetsp:Transcript_29780/g.54533  ORF Transcript_29780/g.54533 Transcript_29780/m.54533 type:complete len:635 (-) Transcript_29780:278-2182(-)|eukprot:CAMPEP_0198294890 /NCGR_PEP_ID=MMETSP1449-20131203/24702_1 /TAXON_ID=420275 /ORGANISM="Attheya septentrionalis, Strain CCMP2084" /LENGTH=634 /DNA_ID=CAMNT_0043994987 /DNA_START=216 /DNA_END=2120 /DNA_ORIENTATION=+
MATEGPSFLVNRRIERSKAWIEMDPNPTTVTHVKALVDAAESSSSGKENACKILETYFPDDETTRIGFGTAGLRSKMMPGPLGMNDLVVIQATQGLARYCLHQQQQQSGGKKLKAVVGYDHRSTEQFCPYKLTSHRFALLASLVFQEAGMECDVLNGLVPTPLLAYSVSHEGAAVGLMMTASHNPKDDAGYKVYWRDGCQIRSPLDTGISECILNNLIPWIDYGSLLTELASQYPDDPCLGLANIPNTQRLTDAYFKAIQTSGLVTHQAMKFDSKIKPPKVVYSAMHGVGYEFAKRSFEVFGLPPFDSVKAQEDPDATFPTVSFPNPEEKGALDLAMAHAQAHGGDVVLANDPDADRLAVAEMDRSTQKWTVFTGDQIGTMLGHFLWTTIGQTSTKPVAMCASTVSSTMLSTIAKEEGFHFEDTLTGFKWIGFRAKELSDEGYKSLFCYEEAIGFCCGDVVHDKDGISAIGVMTELAYNAYHTHSNLSGYLQNLHDTYGEFVSHNGYYFCYDPAIILRILDGMRRGGNYMSHVGEYEIESIRDLGEPGFDSLSVDHRPTLPTSASSPMMTFRFKNGTVAQFRASGTEPKLKYYIEMRGQPGVDRDTVVQNLRLMSKILIEALLKPDENDLIAPS